MAFVPRSLVVLSLLTVCGAGCGDDGRPADEASGTGTGSAPTVTMPDPTTGPGEPTDGASATQGSMSNTMSGTETGTAPTTTNVVETESASGEETVSETADPDTTTGTPAGPCGEDPPGGFMAPFDASCKSEPQFGMFEPVVE